MGEKINETITVISGQNVKMIVQSNESYTAFAGIADNKAIDIFGSDRMCKLLIRAVNNRTRERNYFRLYSQLLEKEITKKEFEREIDSNEDDYVVSNNKEADINDIKIAQFLCPDLMDVDYLENMADLFSFSNDSIQKSIGR